jgi:hypothetical protein
MRPVMEQRLIAADSEERFLRCASRRVRSEANAKKKRRLAPVGMTGLGWAMLPLLLALVACACGGIAKTATTTSSPTSPSQPSSPGATTVTVSPTTANVRAGSSFQFTATVSGNSNTAVNWSVNGTAGGSAALGTITASGNYTAPATLPNPNALTVTATSAASSSASASSAVTILNPTPTLSGINPASTGTGSFSITLTGTNFISGATVMLGNTALTTTFVSSTQLTASGSESTAGIYSVTVVNPDPGSSSSNNVNFQIGASQQASGCSQMSIGQGASLNGFVPFSQASPWNQNITTAAVDSNSTAIINFIGGSIGLHADFGSGEYQGSDIGIPYTVAGAGQAQIPVNFTAYGTESDPGPMPIALNDPIEGDPNPGTGDRHVLVLDNVNCFLYEMDSSYPQTASWNADSAAVWDLLGNDQRPYTWTSADAAGLPIFPGLVRYDEVAAGAINHAIRFTLQNSRAAFIPPASHWAANSSNALAAPMGMRLRLKASFDISGFSATNQVILKAFKTYGIIMADNGSSMFIGGAPDPRWDNNDLHNLGSVTASDFEVMEMSPVYTSANVPTGAAPQISSFTASSMSVTAGTQVTLSWQQTGAGYVIVSPAVGAVRGSSVVVTPTATTTYTLYATNAFGQTTATVTITVH